MSKNINLRRNKTIFLPMGYKVMYMLLILLRILLLNLKKKLILQQVLIVLEAMGPLDNKFLICLKVKRVRFCMEI